MVSLFAFLHHLTAFMLTIEFVLIRGPLNVECARRLPIVSGRLAA